MVTIGNTPNTDILCSNIAGTRFVHIQVKTFVPGTRICSVGMKAERDFGKNCFWVFGGIPKSDTDANFEYYIIPASVMAKNVAEGHRLWITSLGVKGQARKENTVRVVCFPPHKSPYSRLDLSKYRDRWDLIEQTLRA